MAHSERTHLKYAASAASRWLACPGSIRMCAAVPWAPSGPWAQDGTEAHELLEWALRNNIHNAFEAFMVSGLVWEHRKDTEEERLASVQDAIDYVVGLLDAYEDAQLILEHQFVFPSLVSQECGGTNDIIVLVPSLKLMYVVDFKHGAGVAVEVEDNPQLMIYGVGAMDTQLLISAEWTITLVILQPRAFHPNGPVRTWLVEPERLIEFIAEVDDAITECERPDAPLIPGEEQCRWCQAFAGCPAVEAKAMAALQVNFATVKEVLVMPNLPDPVDMPVDKLAEILALEPIAQAFFAKAHDEAYRLAREGYTVPGHKLVEAQARRKWHGAPVEVAAKLTQLANANLDDVFPRKLIGIGEAEDLVKAAYKAAAPAGGMKQAATDAHQAMALLTTKDTSGNLVLVPASDKRQAVSIGSNFAGNVVALPPPIAT